MALSDARRIALFEILEVPMFTTTYKVVVDKMIVEPHNVAGSPLSAVDLIDAHLTANIYTSAGILAVLEALLDEWIDLGTDTSVVDQGSVGNVQGITDSIPMQREEIRRKVLVIVPFWRQHAELERARSASASVMLVR